MLSMAEHNTIQHNTTTQRYTHATNTHPHTHKTHTAYANSTHIRSSEKHNKRHTQDQERNKPHTNTDVIAMNTLFSQPFFLPIIYTVICQRDCSPWTPGPRGRKTSRPSKGTEAERATSSAKGSYDSLSRSDGIFVNMFAWWGSYSKLRLFVCWAW